MRKLMIMAIATVTMLGLTACGGSGLTQSEKDNDYKYASFVYDDNEPQFYMSDSAAAAKTGYYYISGAPVNNNNYEFIYYYDMVEDKTIPLCSKDGCDHRTEDCGAYISKDTCVGSKIWYHNERLYMIERTEGKDVLVSYDKEMSDKKDEKTLSINGMSVNPNHNNACITNGKLYYQLSGDDSMYVCAVSLDSDKQAYIVKQYKSGYHYHERLTLYPIEDKIYVNWQSGISADEYRYYIEQINTATDAVSSLCNMNDEYPDVASTIIDTEWCVQSRYDKDGNIYFACVDDNKYIVRKLNISTGVTKDIYTQEMQHEKDYRYVSLKNYDGRYLYIYKGVNLEALSEKSIEEKLKKYDNYLYILDTDGNVKDTVTLNRTDDKASGNIPITFYGGDERCLLAGFDLKDIRGLELSENEKTIWNRLLDEDAKKRAGTESVRISAVLDKSQIGSGNIVLKQITPETDMGDQNYTADKGKESTGYDNKNIIVYNDVYTVNPVNAANIVNPVNSDRAISESLRDIAANSTQIINATIKSVSYEIIQGNPWTKSVVTVEDVIRGDIQNKDEIMIYSPGGYMPLASHIEYYNDKSRFDMDDNEINNTILHYVVEGESEPEPGENHIYCLQETMSGSPLPEQSYERVCGMASQFDVTDNGNAVIRKLPGNGTDISREGRYEVIRMEDFLNIVGNM